MYTLPVEGVHALADDWLIERALQSHDGTPCSAAHEPRVGIAGVHGKVDRSVFARNLGELAALDKLLNEMGFVEGPPEGIFQAVYYRSLEWLSVHGAQTPTPASRWQQLGRPPARPAVAQDWRPPRTRRHCAARSACLTHCSTHPGDFRMATAKKRAPKDAIAMLKADHKKVSDLFAEFEKARVAKTKRQLVSAICAELSVHAQVEEEVFYPAVKAALKDKELIPEAVAEQATMKNLIAQIEGAEPNGEMYDARVKVLAEYVKHHVREEHTEMFPKAAKSRLDMLALGAAIEARKLELLAAPH